MNTRKAKLIACIRCDEPVLRGLDGDVAAFSAWAGVYPLGEYGEVQALIAGRRTYELHNGRLDRRDQWMIAGTPASSTTVVTDHVCGEPIPDDWVRPIKPQPRREESDGTF